MRNGKALLAVLILSIVGCNSSKKASDSAVDGKKIINYMWEMTALESVKLDQSNTEGKKIYFQLNDDMTVNGYSGCNIFSGQYKLEPGNMIKFSNMASTRMFCPDVKVKEQDVLNVFQVANNYTISNGKLTLTIGKRAPMATFKRVKTSEYMVEKYWKLKTLDGKEMVMQKDQEREMYFMLKGKDKVVGFAGCNNINGTYNIEGSKIMFSQMLTTLRACPNVNINESSFLKMFDGVDNFVVNGDDMTLKKANIIVATFEAIYLK